MLFHNTEKRDHGKQETMLTVTTKYLPLEDKLHDPAGSPDTSRHLAHGPWGNSSGAHHFLPDTVMAPVGDKAKPLADLKCRLRVQQLVL